MSKFLISIIVFSTQIAFSAIPQKSSLKDSAFNILTKSKAERIAWLKKSNKNFKAMEQIAFDSSRHLRVRWASLSSIAHVNNELSYKVLKKASVSKDWFMRDASLKAYTKYYPKEAKQLARKLINDPSLIVRTSAVKAIRRMKDHSASNDLWQKLYDRKNFRNGKSLWIRKHIVATLADFSKENKADKEWGAKFVRVLKEGDVNLYAPAIRGMRSIYNKRLNAKKVPEGIKRDRWISWWEKTYKKNL